MFCLPGCTNGANLRQLDMHLLEHIRRNSLQTNTFPYILVLAFKVALPSYTNLDYVSSSRSYLSP